MLELAILLLPFVVLWWAGRGRGPTARARTQLMTWCTVGIGAFWGGWVGAVFVILLIVGLGVPALRRHRLAPELDISVGSVDMPKFRGRDDVEELAAPVHATPFTACKFPYGKAQIALRLFRLPDASLLSFVRTTLGSTHVDAIWIHAYLPSGLIVSCSDQIQAQDMPAPNESYFMKELPDVISLVEYHADVLRRVQGVPRALTSGEFIEALRSAHRFSLQGAERRADVERVGDAYRFSRKLALRAIYRAFDLFRAIHSEQVIPASVDEHAPLSVPPPSPSESAPGQTTGDSVPPLAWERKAAARRTGLDTALTVLVFAGLVGLLAQCGGSLLP